MSPAERSVPTPGPNGRPPALRPVACKPSRLPRNGDICPSFGHSSSAASMMSIPCSARSVASRCAFSPSYSSWVQRARSWRYSKQRTEVRVAPLRTQFRVQSQLVREARGQSNTARLAEPCSLNPFSDRVWSHKGVARLAQPPQGAHSPRGAAAGLVLTRFSLASREKSALALGPSGNSGLSWLASGRLTTCDPRSNSLSLGATSTMFSP